jgi:hypothetical protein
MPAERVAQTGVEAKGGSRAEGGSALASMPARKFSRMTKLRLPIFTCRSAAASCVGRWPARHEAAALRHRPKRRQGGRHKHAKRVSSHGACNLRGLSIADCCHELVVAPLVDRCEVPADLTAVAISPTTLINGCKSVIDVVAFRRPNNAPFACLS